MKRNIPLPHDNGPALLYPQGILTLNEVREAEGLPPIEFKGRSDDRPIPWRYCPTWWDALGTIIGVLTTIAALVAWSLW